MSELNKPWIIVLGSIFGGVTLLFFMGLALLSVAGHQVPCESRFLVVAVIAFGASLSVAFLGGAAAAKGVLPLPFASQHPISFSVSGGIAVLVMLLLLSNNLFVQDCSDDPIVACPENFQSHFISQLDFGFCYPRSGWEVDRGPIDIKAADIYVRNSSNRDVSVHFHVSLIPASRTDNHDVYSEEIANTWRQLDENLSFSKGFLSSRPAYIFQLNVHDRNGVSRPTEVVHVYLTSEKLLEIISTHFVETDSSTIDDIGMIVSSTSIYK